MSRMKGNTTPIHHFGDYAENIIRDRLERIPGVGTVGVRGGGNKKCAVIIQPSKMAIRSLSVLENFNTLRRANISLTAGDVEEGKRRYVVRTEGEFEVRKNRC